MTIPIVQGTAVSVQPQGGGGGGYNYQPAPHNPPYSKPGSYTNPVLVVEDSAAAPAPERQFRDVIWAVLFLAHLGVVLTLIVIRMSSVDLSSGSDFSQILFLVTIAALAAVALSTAALSFMMRNTETLVQTALIFSVLSSLAIGVVGFMLGNILLGCLGLLSFVIGICYARVVWHRIPFAAANLKTALTAVRANLGLAVLAYLVLALAFGWTLLWFLGLGESLQSSNLGIVFLLFVSYYWVHQVLQNTMQVTTGTCVKSMEGNLARGAGSLTSAFEFHKLQRA